VEEAERWQKVKEIFAAALEREPEQRSAFLGQVCGQDEALLAEIESLLAAHVQSENLSEFSMRAELPQDNQPLQSIGPYRLLEKIGEGGMGQVWLAEQTSPIQRKVALKLIRAGMYDDSLLQRFQAERQSLALMDHPAIAKVFDAGATSGGQPYFVMEYVAGEPITQYCDRKKLKIRDRLKLFVKVCEGVQHAHQKAIVHRDLKPANILVVEQDGQPVPRIIDFGLAKAITPLVPGETLFTQGGGLLGTPGYMSPEQVDPNCRDVDTRSDVYSLGVLLYELLTGFLPFDTKQWKKLPLDQVLRQLREHDPPRPSTRVQSEKSSSTTNAEMRGTDPKHLASLLHGDLDWITLRTMEKDRARRYGSPSELAADIARYLSNEPVLARPANAGYRMRKYVRRHSAALGVSAGLVSLLAGFAVLQAIQLRRITTERDRATRITNFMTGMFQVSDPGEARGNSITVREILDKASRDIDTGLAKDPQLQSQMMYVMGKVYENLGLYPKAQSIFEKALEIQRVAFGPENAETLKTQNELAINFFHEGRFPEAEKNYREVYAIQLRTLGPANPAIAKVRSNLGTLMIREGHYAEAEKILKESLAIQTKTLGPESPEVLVLSLNLASLEISEGHYADAEKMDQETLDLHRRVLGGDHPETLKTMNNMVVILNDEGRFGEAEKLGKETVDSRRRVLGPDHPDTLRSVLNLATSLQAQGHFSEAEEMYRDAIRGRTKALGSDNWETLQTMRSLSMVLLSEGRYAEAEENARSAFEGDRRILGPANPETLESEIDLGAILEKDGHCPESEKLGRDALDAARTALGPSHPEVANAMYSVSLALACNGHFDEAQDMVQQAYKIVGGSSATDKSNDIITKYCLASIAAMQGRRDEALSLLRDSVIPGFPAPMSLMLARDPNLKSLHGDPRFDSLVTKASSLFAATQKQN
jgi:serine/threonine protein kinase/Tfp pilus assembly protein PilF